MRSAAPDADVVVVGGGPTGLMLAAELQLGGADPVVLESQPATSEIPKGNGLFGQIVRLLDYRGLADLLRAEATYAGPAPQFQFGPLQLDFSRLDASPLHVLGMPQRVLERLLGQRLHELGGSIRRGHEVLALSVADDGGSVALDVRGPDGGYRMTTRYLAGCDGAHSLARKQAGIGFPGVTSPDTILIGRVTLPTVMVTPDSREAEVPGAGRVRLMGQNQTPRGSFSLAPLAAVDASAPPGVFIVSTREEAGDAAQGGPAPAGGPGERTAAAEDPPVTLNELRASARRVLGADLPMTDPLWLTRVRGNSRQADRYRAGPVLLAGDAAHLFGAGGSLNAGLLDALNLGWKLAAQVSGWAPDGLLDSYHAERYPAARRVITATRAQRALSARSEYGEALRDLLAELAIYPDVARHLGSMIEGSDIRYEMPAGDVPPHPLAGRVAPDLRLATGEGRTRVAELTRSGRGVLLDLTGGSGDSAVTAAAPSPFADAAAGWADRVDIVAARCLTQPAPAAAMLIRPDAYVAWASGPGTPGSAARGLQAALGTWFGLPRADAA